MNDFDYDFTGQVATRKDRGNSGMSKRGVVDLVQYLSPTTHRKDE